VRTDGANFKVARSAHPVFDPKRFEALEFAFVVRDQDQRRGKRMGGDPKIVAADDLPGLFERGAASSLARAEEAALTGITSRVGNAAPVYGTRADRCSALY
jgi:hypothetical protein